jgi:NAD(P)-dependent dehydrogenase (short-subunit alcohol dehydrogenase family)
MQQVALVTGSSKGIGRSIACELARNSYFVYVTYKTDKRGALETVTEIKDANGQAKAIELDVKDEDSVRRVFDTIKTEFGYLNVLINNAGVEIPKKIEQITLDEWTEVVDTKITGNFLCTKYAIPLLSKQENANVVIITSSLGDRPDPEYPAYCVGTAGTIAFMKAMALYLGKYGIRTNSVSPGTTKTPMWDSLGGEDTQMWESFAKGNPMGRVPTTQDIANATLMIIKDKSQYLNGNIIYVNGGQHLK